MSLGSDPRVMALIKKGDAAVEPLLGVLEKDERLTRSVHFHRDFFRHRSLIGVHEAAYVALSGILHTRFFAVGATGDDLTSRGMEGRRKVAAAIREFWKRWASLSPMDRWFGLLADDAQPPERWIEAAANMVQPTNVETVPGSMVFVETLTYSTPAGQPVPLRGEALRARTGPSVTDLFVRRMNGLSASGQLAEACEMGKALAGWEPRGHASQLAQLATLVYAEMKVHPSDTRLAQCAEATTRARLKGGDTQALGEYAAWLQMQAPHALYGAVREAFALFWENPGDPSVDSAVTAMFGHDGQGWLRDTKGGYFHDPLLRSPLVRVPAYRRYVLRRLADKRAVGTVRIVGASEYELSSPAGTTSSGVDAQTVKNFPPAGTKTPLRACDETAWKMRKKGSPEFEVWWPDAQRDRGIADARAWVTKQAARRDPPSSDDLWF